MATSDQPPAPDELTTPPSTAGTPFSRLGPDVLHLILQHVRRPKPHPAVKATWAQLHQGDLATCLRVNVMFNQVASALLYVQPVVNDFDLFAAGIEWAEPETSPTQPKGVDETYNPRDVRAQLPERRSRNKLECLSLVHRLFIENPDFENGPHLRALAAELGPDTTCDDFFMSDPDSGQEDSLRAILNNNLLRRRGKSWNDGLRRLVEAAARGLAFTSVDSVSMGTYEGPEGDLAEDVHRVYWGSYAIGAEEAWGFENLSNEFVRAVAPQHLCMGGLMAAYSVSLDHERSTTKRASIRSQDAPPLQTRFHAGLHNMPPFWAIRQNLRIDFLPIEYAERERRQQSTKKARGLDERRGGRDYTWARAGALDGIGEAIEELRLGRGRDAQESVSRLKSQLEQSIIPIDSPFRSKGDAELLAYEQDEAAHQEQPVNIEIVPFPIGRRGPCLAIERQMHRDADVERAEEYEQAWQQAADNMTAQCDGQKYGDSFTIVPMSEHTPCPACGLDVSVDLDGRKFDRSGEGADGYHPVDTWNHGKAIRALGRLALDRAVRMGWAGGNEEDDEMNGDDNSWDDEDEIGHGDWPSDEDGAEMGEGDEEDAWA